MRNALKILVLLVMTLAWGAGVQFSAKETLFQGKRIGEVFGNGQTVMRVLSREGALSPYGRAQVIAERLTQKITRLSDFDSIRFSYPSDVYTAILNNEKLFSVYPEEVAANGSTPESLMSDWINNIKRIVAQGPKLVVVSSSETMMVSQSVEDTSQNDAFVELERLKREVALLRTDLKSQGDKSENLFFPIFVIINIILFAGLGFLYWRVSKKLGSLSVLEKTDRLEELENSVSALMRELQETSDTVTDKAKAVIGELDKKLDDAKSFKVEPTAAIPEPIRIEVEVPDSVPMDEPQPALPEEPMTMPESSFMDALKQSLVSEELPQIEPEPPVAVESTPEPEPATPERSLAEQLADEIEKTVDTPETSAESLFLDDDMDPDLKAEVESVIANDSMTKNEKVVGLASLNIQASEIARFLGMGLGEVELILQLAK